MTKDLLAFRVRKKLANFREDLKPPTEVTQKTLSDFLEKYIRNNLGLLDAAVLFDDVSRYWGKKNKLLFSYQMLVAELALFGCLKGLPTLEQAHKEAKELVYSKEEYNSIAQECESLEGNFSRSYFLKIFGKSVVYDEYLSDDGLSYIPADENDIVFDSALYVFAGQKYVDEEVDSFFIFNLPYFHKLPLTLEVLYGLWESDELRQGTTP